MKDISLALQLLKFTTTKVVVELNCDLNIIIVKARKPNADHRQFRCPV